MIIKTFWVMLEGDTGPKCFAAWCQEDIDFAPREWERVKENYRNLLGQVLLSEREIDVKVDDYDILAYWQTDPVAGEVRSARD